MEFVKVESSSRTETGKGVARRLRAEGQIPGVVYGIGRDPQAVSVAREILDRIVRHGSNVLVHLAVDGEMPPEGVAAMIKAIDRHPTTWAPVAVDFQWVSLTEAVNVSVPVVLVGSPIGVREEGGVLEQMLYDVEVRCLPTNIPGNVEYDVSELGMNESVHASVLTLPEGVEMVTDPESALAAVAPPRVIEEEKPEAEEGLEEELGEGELAEGEGEGEREAEEE